MIYKLSDLNRKNFKAIEFYRSSIATSSNVDNVPKEQSTLENLDMLADKMQEVRDVLNTPVNITSGFRCLELNQKLTNSSKDSFHMYGLAADFVVKDKDPAQIAKILLDHVNVDKLIASYIDKNDKRTCWTHLQIQSDPFKNRNIFIKEEINDRGISYKKLF